MFRTLIIIIRVAFTLLFSLPKLRKVNQLSGMEKYSLANDYSRIWAKKVLQISGVELEIQGEKNITGKPAVFIGNHSSFYDIPICMASIDHPKTFLSKIENRKIPGLHPWMIATGCEFIDRENIRQQVKVIERVIDKIKKGLSYVIFPEGTRTADGQLGEFKPGSLKIATRAEAIIQPFAIQGSYQVLKKGSLKVKKGKVIIRFGTPIVTDKSMNKETVALTEKVHGQVKQLIEEINENIIKES